MGKPRTAPLPKAEFLLHESLEVTGVWWLPDKPDRKIHGTLRFDGSDTELEVIESLSEIDILELMSGKVPSAFIEYPCIFGMSDLGQKFSLLKARLSSASSSFTIAADFVICALHLKALDEAVFDRVQFRCSQLDGFSSCNPIQVEYGAQFDGHSGCIVKCAKLESSTWRVDSMESMFEIGMNVSLQAKPLASSIVARAFAAIRPDSPKDIKWLLSKVNQFCWLLGLLTNRPSVPLEVRIDTAGDWGWLLYRMLPVESAMVADRWERYLLTLFHLKSCFGVVLEKFYSASESLADAMYLTIDAMRSPTTLTSGRFLLASHAVEVSSRATADATYMNQTDYQLVISELESAIPKTVSSAHRTSLENKIKYGNEYSFAKRIKSQIEGLSLDARGLVCRNLNDFARGISDTRNYYTHFTDELRKKALIGANLHWATEKLLNLQRIVLLKYLGIDEALIVERIRDMAVLGQETTLALQARECVGEPKS